jgi:hypothetical protein
MGKRLTDAEFCAEQRISLRTLQRRLQEANPTFIEGIDYEDDSHGHRLWFRDEDKRANMHSKLMHDLADMLKRQNQDSQTIAIGVLRYIKSVLEALEKIKER